MCVGFIATDIQASTVRGDIDYQYFRDFGENKGLFKIGASNITIYDKNGNDVGMMMKDIPMPDLKTANRLGGYANLIDPSFLTSVHHNVGYGKVQFGGEDSNPDSHHYDYLLTNRNDFPEEWDGKKWLNPQEVDYHIPRLHKMVTEVGPAEVIDFITSEGTGNKELFVDSKRFPIYARAGSGTQYVVDTPDDTAKGRMVSDAYNFITGGTTHTMSGVNNANLVANGTVTPEGKRITDRPITLFGSIYGPMITYGRLGDSGSGLLAYDSEQKKWLLVGVMKSDYGYGNIWSLTRYSFIQHIQNQANAGEINNQSSGQTWEWSSNSSAPETSTIKSGSSSLNVNLRNDSIKSQDTGKARPSLDYGKTVRFKGTDGGVLVLKNNIDQGAGALYFDTNFTFRADNNQTWVGAGVSVAKDKTVTWQVANPKDDRLSKLGAGTLHVKGTGVNQGDISVGDGTVILDQQADSKGKKQAFNQVGITSGRGTVILNSPDQVDPNKIYFGFRGGRLDLNGNSLSFYYIQNVDDGAKIVNNNLEKEANIELGKYPEEYLKIPTNELAEGDFYANFNPFFRSYDYYLANTSLADRKKNVNDSYFPIIPGDNKYWTYIGDDKKEAIKQVVSKKIFTSAYNGYFGEQNNQAKNGKLNINYRPDNGQSVYMFSGGMNINGDLTIDKGELILSGVPTSHAYDFINKKDVVYDDDWISRDYKANNITVNPNATLTVSRNVSTLAANINAKDNTTMNLGYTAGQKVCIRSDFTGVVNCTTPTYDDKALNSMPRMQLNGNIAAGENTTINVGKTDLRGNIKGTNSTTANLSKDSHWYLSGDNSLHNLTLAEGSQVTLNPTNGSYTTLTLDNMSGKGKFNYYTNFSGLEGDKVVVNGDASGEYKITVADTSNEPGRSDDRLTLMQFNKGADNVTVSLDSNYADLGALRYQLIQEGNTFRLYNPIVEKDLEAERKAAEEAARQQEEAKRLEEERKAAEEKARLEELARQAEAEKARLEELARQEAAEKERLAELARQAEAEKARLAELARQAEAEKAKAEELARQAAEAEKAAEAARLAAEKEAAEEAARQAAAKVAAEEQAKAAAAAAELERQQAEAARKAEELKAAEEKAKQDALARQAEEEKLKQEAEARQAEEEKVKQDASTRQVEEARLAAESSARSEAETVARLQAEAKRVEDERKAAAREVLKLKLAGVKQSEFISRIANTALTELSGQVNVVVQNDLRLNNNLVQDPATETRVWSNVDVNNRTYSSDYYRSFKQDNQHSDLGIESAVNGTGLSFGGQLSQTRVNETYDDASGNRYFTKGTFFSKLNSDKGTFVVGDLSYGHSGNKVVVDGQATDFVRDVISTGVTLGHRLSVAGVNIKPILGARYHHVSSVSYQVGDSKIDAPSMNLYNYYAGVSLAKTWAWDYLTFTPNLSVNYYDTKQNSFDAQLKVNDVAFEQKFNSGLQYQAGFEVGAGGFYTGLSYTYDKGKQTSGNSRYNLNLGYKF